MITFREGGSGYIRVQGGEKGRGSSAVVEVEFVV